VADNQELSGGIMKKYALVRVDNACPAILDNFGCISARKILHCKCGEDCKNYGDTKEQLVRKVAQVLLRQDLSYEVFSPSKEMVSAFYEGCLRRAKQIVEFLGVK